MSKFLPTLVLGFATTTIATAAGPVSYQMIELSVGQGKAIRLPGAADAVAVARPEIADVQVPAPTTMFVFGKSPGRSTVQAFAKDGRVISNIDVKVTPETSALRERLAELPGARAASTTSGSAVRLDGDVATPLQAFEAINLATQAAGKADLVVGDLRVSQPTQVNLRVRIAEVSRSVSRELGFNWESLIGIGGSQFLIGVGRDIINVDGSFSRSPTGADSFGIRRTGNSTDFNAVIDALANDGLVTVLAEPNLTARSGETASFLSGGEFPIPVNNNTNNSVSIQFKQFGIGLDFTPTVMDDGRISLKVRPEVSELDQTSGIEVNGLRIPGLKVRRADTTVELGSGQSFAIAGLVSANSTNNVHKIPGLGSIPILGALFRSTKFQRNETELVIMVTPYLVRPVSSPTRIALPTDPVVPAVDFKSLLLGKLSASATIPGRGPVDLPSAPYTPGAPVAPGGPSAPAAPSGASAAAGAPPSTGGDADIKRVAGSRALPAPPTDGVKPANPNAAASLNLPGAADPDRKAIAIQDIGFLLE